MSQRRVNITYIDGKAVSAVLQEMEAFDTNGVVYWKTIRPFPVLKDGTILYIGEEEPEQPLDERTSTEK